MFQKKDVRPDTELFVYFDSKTQSYGTPMQAMNKNDIVREIINMFRDPQQKSSKLFTNAEDFSLFKVGEYSKLTGLIVSQNLEHIANLHDLRALAEPSAPSPGIVPT